MCVHEDRNRLCFSGTCLTFLINLCCKTSQDTMPWSINSTKPFKVNAKASPVLQRKHIAPFGVGSPVPRFHCFQKIQSKYFSNFEASNSEQKLTTLRTPPSRWACATLSCWWILARKCSPQTALRVGARSRSFPPLFLIVASPESLALSSPLSATKCNVCQAEVKWRYMYISLLLWAQRRLFCQQQTHQILQNTYENLVRPCLSNLTKIVRHNWCVKVPNSLIGCFVNSTHAEFHNHFWFRVQTSKRNWMNKSAHSCLLEEPTTIVVIFCCERRCCPKHNFTGAICMW